MPEPTCADFELVRGQNKVMQGQVVEEIDGITPVNMTPDGKVKWATSSGLIKSTDLGTITWVNQAQGIFQWEITSAQSLAFPNARYTHLTHEAWAKLPMGVGGRVYRLWSGTLVVSVPLTTPP